MVLRLNGHGLMVRIHDLRAASGRLAPIPEKSMVVAERHSLLSSNTVSLLTREQTPRPRTECKLISVPLMIILIVLCIGHVEITPWSRAGTNDVKNELRLDPQGGGGVYKCCYIPVCFGLSGSTIKNTSWESAWPFISFPRCYEVQMV